MSKYFGTDGFRGRANESLTVDHAFRIGRCLGWYYAKEKRENERAKIVIGKDTRRSSYMFEAALTAGITASGADVYLMHVTTTPSVAFLVRTQSFDCGIMISASHNAYEDNGIKLISSGGEKADEALISVVERALDRRMTIPLATDEQIGRTVDYVSGRNQYIAFLLSVPVCSLRGYRIGLDCANGSAWTIAKAVFDALGAQVFVRGAQPDGMNINEKCGSTQISYLQMMVKEYALDFAFAFDGDADRCICVDDRGEAVDGDGILYLCARFMRDRGELNERGIVATVMSNAGLSLSLNEEAIKCVRTQVGDRYVFEEMLRQGALLGGEQSGHVIFRKYATTGDGILTAIKVAEAVCESKCPLSVLVEPLKKFPQIQYNVPVKNRYSVVKREEVLAAIFQSEKMLGGEGRILLRPSGTEELVRILVEGKSRELCEQIAARLVRAIESAAQKGAICAES